MMFLANFWLNLEELSVVSYSLNYLVHIVCLVWIVWDNLVQEVFLTVDRVSALYTWCFLAVI